MTNALSCRACSSSSGTLVLDLGIQPACDHFPDDGDPGRDARYPLQMWLCSSCGLAQLLGEPTLAEEALGAEPQALVDQAADAVDQLATSGWLAGRRRVAEIRQPAWRLVAELDGGAGTRDGAERRTSGFGHRFVRNDA